MSHDELRNGGDQDRGQARVRAGNQKQRDNQQPRDGHQVWLMNAFDVPCSDWLRRMTGPGVVSVRVVIAAVGTTTPSRDNNGSNSPIGRPALAKRLRPASLWV